MAESTCESNIVNRIMNVNRISNHELDESFHAKYVAIFSVACMDVKVIDLIR